MIKPPVQNTFFPKTNSCHLSCGSQASNACLVCSGSLQFCVHPSRPLILNLCLANGFFCGQPVHMDIHSNAGLLAPCNTHAQVRHLWPHLAVQLQRLVFFFITKPTPFSLQRPSTVSGISPPYWSLRTAATSKMYLQNGKKGEIPNLQLTVPSSSRTQRA